MTQIDVYTEEKFEDEEDMRERTRVLFKDSANAESSVSMESELAFGELIRLAKQHEGLYPLMLDTMKHYGLIFQREID